MAFKRSDVHVGRFRDSSDVHATAILLLTCPRYGLNLPAIAGTDTRQMGQRLKWQQQSVRRRRTAALKYLRANVASWRWLERNAQRRC